MSESEQKQSVSFYSKQTVDCPCCRTKIKKEEILSGGGRMNAGNLTDELRRLYIPSPKYGPVYPFIYAVGTCPNCNLSLFWPDFPLLDKTDAEKIREIQDKLLKDAQLVFPYADFNRNKSLLDAGASHYMALMCYDQVNKNMSPTIKRGLLCLRLAWICGDLHELCPGHNFDYVQKQFYVKALFFYEQAMQGESKGIEKITNITTFGPDADKNYGFDGVIYLTGALEYKYGQRENMELRLKKIEEHKRALARMFGFGKSNKAKPGPFLEIARGMYDAFMALLKEAGQETED